MASGTLSGRQQRSKASPVPTQNRLGEVRNEAQSSFFFQPPHAATQNFRQSGTSRSGASYRQSEPSSHQHVNLPPPSNDPPHHFHYTKQVQPPINFTSGLRQLDRDVQFLHDPDDDSEASNESDAGCTISKLPLSSVNQGSCRLDSTSVPSEPSSARRTSYQSMICLSDKNDSTEMKGEDRSPTTLSRPNRSTGWAKLKQTPSTSTPALQSAPNGVRAGSPTSRTYLAMEFAQCTAGVIEKRMFMLCIHLLNIAKTVSNWKARPRDFCGFINRIISNARCISPSVRPQPLSEEEMRNSGPLDGETRRLIVRNRGSGHSSVTATGSRHVSLITRFARQVSESVLRHCQWARRRWSSNRAEGGYWSRYRGGDHSAEHLEGIHTDLGDQLYSLDSDSGVNRPTATAYIISLKKSENGRKRREGGGGELYDGEVGANECLKHSSSSGNGNCLLSPFLCQLLTKPVYCRIACLTFIAVVGLLVTSFKSIPRQKVIIDRTPDSPEAEFRSPPAVFDSQLSFGENLKENSGEDGSQHASITGGEIYMHENGHLSPLEAQLSEYQFRRRNPLRPYHGSSDAQRIKSRKIKPSRTTDSTPNSSETKMTVGTGTTRTETHEFRLIGNSEMIFSQMRVQLRRDCNIKDIVGTGVFGRMKRNQGGNNTSDVGEESVEDESGQEEVGEPRAPLSATNGVMSVEGILAVLNQKKHSPASEGSSFFNASCSHNSTHSPHTSRSSHTARGNHPARCQPLTPSVLQLSDRHNRRTYRQQDLRDDVTPTFNSFISNCILTVDDLTDRQYAMGPNLLDDERHLGGIKQGRIKQRSVHPHVDKPTPFGHLKSREPRVLPRFASTAHISGSLEPISYLPEHRLPHPAEAIQLAPIAAVLLFHMSEISVGGGSTLALLDSLAAQTRIPMETIVVVVGLTEQDESNSGREDEVTWEGGSAPVRTPTRHSLELAFFNEWVKFVEYRYFTILPKLKVYSLSPQLSPEWKNKSPPVNSPYSHRRSSSSPRRPSATHHRIQAAPPRSRKDRGPLGAHISSPHAQRRLAQSFHSNDLPHRCSRETSDLNDPSEVNEGKQMADALTFAAMHISEDYLALVSWDRVDGVVEVVSGEVDLQTKHGFDDKMNFTDGEDGEHRGDQEIDVSGHGKREVEPDGGERVSSAFIHPLAMELFSKIIANRTRTDVIEAPCFDAYHRSPANDHLDTNSTPPLSRSQVVKEWLSQSISHLDNTRFTQISPHPATHPLRDRVAVRPRPTHTSFSVEQSPPEILTRLPIDTSDLRNSHNEEVGLDSFPINISEATLSPSAGTLNAHATSPILLTSTPHHRLTPSLQVIRRSLALRLPPDPQTDSLTILDSLSSSPSAVPSTPTSSPPSPSLSKLSTCSGSSDTVQERDRPPLYSEVTGSHHGPERRLREQPPTASHGSPRSVHSSPRKVTRESFVASRARKKTQTKQGHKKSGKKTESSRSNPPDSTRGGTHLTHSVIRLAVQQYIKRLTQTFSSAAVSAQLSVEKELVLYF
eukprot:GHVN01051945.1.p1 GENE.GHVN01051945.1~~GHVN01051945.1.p1  ORF type:complete len:1511 (-),score=326.97 GHVN01051945.1:275-4807(-)